jgi:hypothetical protein
MFILRQIKQNQIGILFRGDIQMSLMIGPALIAGGKRRMVMT